MAMLSLIKSAPFLFRWAPACRIPPFSHSFFCAKFRGFFEGGTAARNNYILLFSCLAITIQDSLGMV